MIFNFLFRITKFFSNRIPVWIPHGTAFGNRIGKFFYKLSSQKGMQAAMFWDNIRMKVNPLEHVGGNLYFNPQFRLKPTYLLIEINGGPKRQDLEYNNRLRDCLLSEGYVEEVLGDNSLFTLHR